MFLFSRVRERLGALRRRRREAGQPRAAELALEVAMPWIVSESRFPEVRSEPDPLVSVVIPAFGELPMTLRCLHAVARAAGGASHEVIVVDDASQPSLVDALGSTRGLKVERLEAQRGFVGAANRGAAVARGRLLVFLNNDTAVCDGWLDALSRRLLGRDVGIVGGQLVSPDGRVQEAGGIVWRDGSATNYGRGLHPEAPAVAFARPVDYVSAACLMIEHRLFRELGGFDERYAPGYYEDVDLAFRVRASGLRVEYEPAARVYHLEGGTAGTDLGSGMKRFQERNQRVFRDRWPHVLLQQPTRELGPDLARVHGAGRACLVVDRQLPTPARDAGSQRLSRMLRELLEMGWQVTLAAFDLADGAERPALESAGIEVLRRPFVHSLEAYLRAHGRRFDRVLLSRLGVARRLLPTVARLCPSAGVVFDTVDLRSLREGREAALRDDSRARKRAERTRKAELRMVAKADATLVTSPIEREYLARQNRIATIAVVPTSYPVVRPQMEFERRSGALFIGGFGHAPNVDGILWFLDEIWPRVKILLPEFQLHVLGEEPPQELYRRARAGVHIHGFVPDVSAFFEQVRMSVAPLRFGAGLKGKVHQSLALGLPCVATPIAAEGLGLMPDLHAVLAAGANDFAEGVIRLNSDRDLWQRLSIEGRAHVGRYFSDDAMRAGLVQALSARRGS
ncbi:MAG: glycosyltransferase [Acidobacteriota bacterium]|nr:glycosyltransferase [Acidobacteriota bacterium]